MQLRLRKELPAIIVTLQQVYETSGDAEAFGLSTLLYSFTAVACVEFLSWVLDILAILNVAVQKKTVDFSRLKVFLQSTTGVFLLNQHWPHSKTILKLRSDATPSSLPPDS